MTDRKVFWIEALAPRNQQRNGPPSRVVLLERGLS